MFFYFAQNIIHTFGILSKKNIEPIDSRKKNHET